MKHSLKISILKPRIQLKQDENDTTQHGKSYPQFLQEIIEEDYTGIFTKRYN